MIGVFDSGSGGLTVLAELRKRLPSADVVYFGDIEHAPYGSRSRQELFSLTVRALTFLKEHGAGKIISACNSVSASLALSLLDALSVAPGDLIEMVGPAVSHFKGSPARFLLCATPATIASGIYQDAFRMIGKDISVIAIPDLAGAIEFGAPEDEQRMIIREAFAGVTLSGFDVLILGCTHYPFALPLFKEVMPSSVSIFDPAVAVAERAGKQFVGEGEGAGHVSFYISADSLGFRKRVASLFPDDAGSIQIAS